MNRHRLDADPPRIRILPPNFTHVKKYGNRFVVVFVSLAYMHVDFPNSY